jgi:hypothetical protein
MCSTVQTIDEKLVLYRIPQTGVGDSDTCRKGRNRSRRSPRKNGGENRSCGSRGENSGMEAARLGAGPSRRSARQGHFRGEAEVALNVFFDSSALAKRYINEKGSDRVQVFCFSVGRIGDLCSGNRLRSLPPAPRTQTIHQRASNDLNGAQRLNGLNDLNGLRHVIGARHRFLRGRFLL